MLLLIIRLFSKIARIEKYQKKLALLDLDILRLGDPLKKRTDEKARETANIEGRMDSIFNKKINIIENYYNISTAKMENPTASDKNVSVSESDKRFLDKAAKKRTPTR